MSSSIAPTGALALTNAFGWAERKRARCQRPRRKPPTSTPRRGLRPSAGRTQEGATHPTGVRSESVAAEGGGEPRANRLAWAYHGARDFAGLRRDLRPLPRLQVAAVPPLRRTVHADGTTRRPARPDRACAAGWNAPASAQTYRQPSGSARSWASARATKVDVVTAIYLLNYARTAEEAERFGSSCFRALRSGGLRVGFNDNVRRPPRPDDVSLAKYGLERTAARHPPHEGDAIRYRITTTGRSSSTTTA